MIKIKQKKSLGSLGGKSAGTEDTSAVVHIKKKKEIVPLGIRLYAFEKFLHLKPDLTHRYSPGKIRQLIKQRFKVNVSSMTLYNWVRRGEWERAKVEMIERAVNTPEINGFANEWIKGTKFCRRNFMDIVPEKVLTGPMRIVRTAATRCLINSTELFDVLGYQIREIARGLISVKTKPYAEFKDVNQAFLLNTKFALDLARALSGQGEIKSGESGGVSIDRKLAEEINGVMLSMLVAQKKGLIEDAETVPNGTS